MGGVTTEHAVTVTSEIPEQEEKKSLTLDDSKCKKGLVGSGVLRGKVDERAMGVRVRGTGRQWLTDMGLKQVRRFVETSLRIPVSQVTVMFMY